MDKLMDNLEIATKATNAINEILVHRKKEKEGECIQKNDVGLRYSKVRTFNINILFVFHEITYIKFCFLQEMQDQTVNKATCATNDILVHRKQEKQGECIQKNDVGQRCRKVRTFNNNILFVFD